MNSSAIHQLISKNIKTYQQFQRQSPQIRRSAGTYQARRALLYVPGDDERKLNKTAQLNVDCIAVDCEDGVSINRKDEARQSIRKFFDHTLPAILREKGPHSHTEWAVRLNSRSSGLLEEDLRVVMSAENKPKTLLMPKCESSGDLTYFNDQLRKRAGSASNPIQLIIFIESASAMLNLPAICSTASELSKRDCLFEPAAIVFGSDDFCASIGATRTEDSQEILYARQKCVLVAKAFDLQAIDMVYIQFKDLDGLKRQCEAGARMGYTGKQIIHPGQIDVVHTAFSPSTERIEWAAGMITAFDEHQKIGKGAFVYRNQMIDMPTVKQAYNVLHLHKRIGK